MSGQLAREAMPESGYAPPYRGDALSPRRTPRPCQLLAALPLKDFERLQADLWPIPLPLGWTVYGAAEQERYRHILITGTVARFYAMGNGASAQFTSTGGAGATRVASLLGGESALSDAVVLSAGNGCKAAEDLRNLEFEHGGALPQLLLRYTPALIVQSGHTAAQCFAIVKRDAGRSRLPETIIGNAGADCTRRQ